ncbi:MAG: DUF2059 domain-containing protein [Gammaproteobacteria bacterium]|nr:DUF2059 domain-containing protein [Gammaproteobacteria bacterium]NVK88852.1 DUF2059 domain-containing protein [Gammaproteobacteria bacterium]
MKLARLPQCRSAFFIFTLAFAAFFTAIPSMAKDNLTEKFIDATMTEKSMEIGIKASLLQSCARTGKSQQACMEEAKVVDSIDFKAILSKVFEQVYTEEQMQQLYDFYSSELGQKYQQGMLSMLTQQLRYPEKVAMPTLTKEEDALIRQHQASKLSAMERAAQPKLRALIGQYVPKALQAAGVQ